jgi:predicted DNA-binding protein
MPGNPKDSPWYSTPRSERKKKGTELMLSDEARERLEKLAKKHGVSKSEMVEQLIMEAPLR